MIFCLSILVLGEENYRSLYLVAPEYKEAVKSTTASIDNDKLLKDRQTLILQNQNNNKTKPSEKVVVPAINGQPEVSLYIYRPASMKKGEKLPTIYYTHGGGYILGTANMYSDKLTDLVNENNVILVSAEYRLATEATFPADVEDAYRGLAYIFDNANKLGIDKNKIILMGDSAGRGLATRLGLLTRDRKKYNLVGQILIYPMLDYRTGTSASPYNSSLTGEFVWTAKSNQFGWAKLRGNKNISEKEMPYFSPAMVKDVSNSPKTFMIVGTLDLFVNEDIDYANKLIQAGVETELHVIPGVVHGYQNLVPTSPQALEFTRLRNAAIQRMIGRK